MKFLIVSVVSLLLWSAAPLSYAIENAVVEAEWQEYIDAIEPLGPELVPLMYDPEDPQLRQELYQYIFGAMSAAHLYLFVTDVEHPEFVPFLHQAHSGLGANPDDVYYLTHLEPEGIYRISGFRGTVRIVDFQIGADTLFPRGGGGPGATLANYFLDDLSLGPNGEFDVILSQTRPEGYKGDWWPLHADASHIILRQISYDWLNEVDARIAIQRLDTPAQKERMSVEKINRELKQRAVLARSWIAFSREMIRKPMEEGGLVNKVKGIFYEEGGRSDQMYVIGKFDLQPDEAMIFETDMPEECLYWNIQITDELWRSIDWIHRQTSLNGFQAKIDDDGKFRAVLSSQDPGVHNWIDTVDYQRGTIFNRWSQCSSFPEPTVKVVKFSEVSRHLPASTSRVSEAEREAIIRERSRAVQLRRRW